MSSSATHPESLSTRAGTTCWSRPDPQAVTWRTGHPRSPHGTLPDLIFPADRSWLVSALWDDTWTCVGGPRHLIDALAADILVQSRSVQLDEDATPPGHHYT